MVARSGCVRKAGADPPLGGTEALVVIALALHMRRKTVWCWPSQELLAHITGRSVRACRWAVKRLEAAGIITIGPKGRGKK